MRYLISFDDGSMDHIPEADWPAVAEASHAVVRQAQAAGVWIFGGGVLRQQAAIFAVNGTSSPGPLPEAKAVVGGFSIIEVPTREEVLAWAARFAASCRCAQEVREIMYDPESGVPTPMPPRRAAVAESRALQSWQDYQDALIKPIAPLTAEQLQRRLLPGRRTPGELAEHIVFGRALHLCRALGNEPAELQPFLTWDGSRAATQTSGEIVRGLEVTWRSITACLMGGQEDAPAPAVQTIWGLLDHDLPHAGQLSLLLRADGLAGVEI